MDEPASPRPDEPVSELGEALRSAVGRLYRRFRAERPPGELGDVALGVLTRLHKRGPHTLTALSDEYGVSLAAMSETVNRLTTDGYAVRTRDTTDRRRILLSATPSGDRLAAAARAQRHAWFDAGLASLSPEERALLRQAASLLDRVIDQDSSTGIPTGP